MCIYKLTRLLPCPTIVLYVKYYYHKHYLSPFVFCIVFEITVYKCYFQYTIFVYRPTCHAKLSVCSICDNNVVLIISHIGVKHADPSSSTLCLFFSQRYVK